jgi:hypothetical protein
MLQLKYLGMAVRFFLVAQQWISLIRVLNGSLLDWYRLAALGKKLTNWMPIWLVQASINTPIVGLPSCHWRQYWLAVRPLLQNSIRLAYDWK